MGSCHHTRCSLSFVRDSPSGILLSSTGDRFARDSTRLPACCPWSSDVDSSSSFPSSGSSASCRCRLHRPCTFSCTAPRTSCSRGIWYCRDSVGFSRRRQLGRDSQQASSSIHHQLSRSRSDGTRRESPTLRYSSGSRIKSLQAGRRKWSQNEVFCLNDSWANKDLIVHVAKLINFMLELRLAYTPEVAGFRTF